jgi:hypothetical protein
MLAESALKFHAARKMFQILPPHSQDNFAKPFDRDSLVFVNVLTIQI